MQPKTANDHKPASGTRIERQSFSVNPWRLVLSSGQQVSWQVPFDHAFIGMTLVNEPVSGRTRAEATAKALQLLEQVLLTNARLFKELADVKAQLQNTLGRAGNVAAAAGCLQGVGDLGCECDPGAEELPAGAYTRSRGAEELPGDSPGRVGRAEELPALNP